MHYKTHKKQEQEDYKEYLRNSRKRHSDSAESEQCRHQGDHKEHQRVVKQFGVPPAQPWCRLDASLASQNRRSGRTVARETFESPRKETAPVDRSFSRPHNCSVRVMIRKLRNGDYRLYSRKTDPNTGKRRNLGTFGTREDALKHERAVQFFKRAHGA